MIVLDYVIWYLLLALERANWLSQGKSSHLQMWTCALGPHNQQCCLIVIGNIEYLRLLTGVHHHLPTFGASWILSIFQFDIFPGSMIWALKVFFCFWLYFSEKKLFLLLDTVSQMLNSNFQKWPKQQIFFFLNCYQELCGFYGPFWGDAVVASPHSGLATPHGKVAISVGPYVFVKVPLLVLFYSFRHIKLFLKGESKVRDITNLKQTYNTNLISLECSAVVLVLLSQLVYLPG